MSKFSVLMSVYRREQPQFLREALESLFCQTRLPDEVVLVKDGPLTEELEAVIADFSNRFGERLHLLPLAENVGLGGALNAGLSACRYELVARMDSDDISAPDRFERQLELFEQDESLAVASGWIEEFDERGESRIKRLPESDQQIKEYALKRCPIHHPCAMFRKSAVLRSGSYQHFYLLEDYYLWLRMIRIGARFYNIQIPLLRFRSTSDMFRRRGGWRYAQSEYRLFRYMYQNGMIGLGRFLFNASARFVVRISPTWFRQWVYLKLLR